MGLATIASIVGIASGINNLRNSRKAPQVGQEAAAISDPAIEDRPQFRNWVLQNWPGMSKFDPKAVERDPGYQFQLQEGISNIDRAASAAGMLRSGTRLEDLTKFSSGLASDYVQKQFERNMRLMGMAGQFGGFTTGSPAAAGQAVLQGDQNGWARENSALGQIGASFQQLSRMPNIFGNTGNYGTIDPTQAGSGLPY